MHRRAPQAIFLCGALLACSAGQSLPKNSPAEPDIVNIPATTGRANLPATTAPFGKTELGRFNSPFAFAVLPGNGGILVTEKAGVLKWRRPDGAVVIIAGTAPVAKVDQGGLLDVVAAPDFEQSRTIYLTYSEPGAGGSALALARATLDAKSARLADFSVVWRSGSNGPGGQFGAKIAFAPDGKSLFLASGERQRFTPAQDPDQALGKIVHLTLDGKAARDNPDYAKGGVRAITWSSGHRNPYGLLFTPDGALWEHEMGPKGGDELNVILPGRNYGWPIVSNGDNYSGQPIPDHPSRPEFEAPKLWWNPSISPSGMIYYSGDKFPSLKGSLLITSMSTPGLSQVAISGAMAKSVAFWDFGVRLRDIEQGADGQIYLIEDGPGAKLWRLEPGE